MDKEIVRKKGIERLAKLADQPEIKMLKEKKLYQQLFSEKLWQKASVVGVTLSMKNELDTQPIIEQAFLENKIVVVPKTYPKRKMAFIEINSKSTYITSNFGVKEPESDEIFQGTIDLLLVPGVIFHSDGYRIGFGGGFYDRYLANFTGNTVSLVFTEQLFDQWQPEDFDIPVQQLIIEKK